MNALNAVLSGLMVIMIWSGLSAQMPQWIWADGVGGANNDVGLSIATDSEGYVYVTGRFYESVTLGSITLTSTGGNNVFVAKIDTDGNYIWAVSGGANMPKAMALDAAANVYITGWFNGTAVFGSHTITSAGAEDIFVAKLSSDGAWLWASSFGGTLNDNGFAIAVDSCSQAYVTGWFSGSIQVDGNTLTSYGLRDILLVKFDIGGGVMWAEHAGGTAYDEGYGIVLDAVGNIYLSGYFTGTANFGNSTLTSYGEADIFVTKLDSSGDFLWTRQAGSSFNDIGRGIKVLDATDIYLTGSFAGPDATFGDHSISSNNSSSDIFLTRLDANGNWLWVIGAGSGSSDTGYDLDIDSVNNIVTTGYFTGTATFGNNTLVSSGEKDIFAAAANSDGNWLWAAQAGGDYADDVGWDIAVDDACGIYLTGWFEGSPNFGDISLTSNGYSDAFIAKLSSGVDIDDESVAALPFASILYEPCPNPIHLENKVRIRADLAKGERGTLDVFNLRGQRIVQYNLGQGANVVNLDIRDWPAGIYLYQLNTGTSRIAKRLILLK